MLDGLTAHASTQAVQQGSIAVAAKALDNAKLQGQAAVSLIATAGTVQQAGQVQSPQSPAAPVDGTGRYVNVRA